MTAPAHTAFIVSLHVKPGREEEFLALLTPVLDAMRREATFVNAVLHRDPADPARFMLYETWTDLDDVVTVQMKRDYRRAGQPGPQPMSGDFASAASGVP